MIAAVLALLGFAKLSAAAALDAAVAHSPDVAAANARVAQVAATLAVARASLAPAFTAGYTQTPQGNPPGPNVVSRLATVGLQTNVSDFIAYGANERQNVLLLESSRDDALAAIRTERVKAAGLYYDALKARAILDARARALDLARAERAAAQKRFDAGDGPRLDTIRADVAVAKATADLEAARGDDANATEALALETGVGASDLEQTIDEPNPVPTDPDPLASTQTALASRAEIRSAIATEHAAEASRNIVASGGPALTIGAGYTEGTDSGVPVQAPTMNVTFSVPLGSGQHDRVRVEDGKIAEAHARVESTRRSVTLEVGASARDVAALRRAAEASTRAREGAELEFAATDLGYRNGASSSLDVRSAETAYAQALVDERSALYDLAKARATLALEMGN